MQDGFPCGLAVGVSSTFALCYFIDPRVGPIFGSEAISVFAIIATLAAAAIAYSGVLRQITHQNEIEKNRKAGELEAERAALPIALSRVCEISRRGIQDVVEHKNVYSELANENMHLEITHIESIKAMIKVSPPDVQSRLQSILAGYQLAMASLDGNLGGSLVKAPASQSLDGKNRIALCFRWALLYSLAESLFDFSRGGREAFTGRFPDQRVLSAVRLSGVVPSQFDDFSEFFQRMINRYANKPLGSMFAE